MVCTVTCSISSIFLIGMFYMTYAIDKCSVTRNFVDSLSTEQRDQYYRIVNKRRTIYLTGFMIGALLSVYVVSTMYQKNPNTSKLSAVCMAGTVTFITAYFCYILWPKPPLMVLELNEKKQREEWVKVYKKMQQTYHIGLLLGLISVVGFTNAMC